MDVDADDHGEKRIPFSGMDSHIMEMVVIQNPVVYPFAGSPVVVNLWLFIRSSRDGWIKADITLRLRVDSSAISRRRTFFFTWTGIHLATGKRAAPFPGMFLFDVSPVDHAVASHA